MNRDANAEETELNDKKSVTSRKPTSSFKSFLKSLGPGLITDASDGNPSGIATYSQVGTQFGFGMLWMALFQYPMMTVIQEMLQIEPYIAAIRNSPYACPTQVTRRDSVNTR